jgi:lysophospholipase L1-like esterase
MQGVSTRVKLVVTALLTVLLLIGAAFIVTTQRSDPEPQAEGSESTGTGAKVAFYGDSYTLGTGASNPGKRWSTIVSRERNWDEFNPSVNGLGFVNNRSVYGKGDLPSLIIDARPDIVIVTMGLNDNFSYDSSADDIHARIDDDFTRLHTALPDARIVVVEPFWYTDERPESVDVIAGWVRDAAGGIDADYIPGASRWIEGHPEWMADDGLHPNDDGYAAMAARMDDELRKLGL